MHVEISKDGQVQSVQRKDGNISHSQKAYLHTGAAYPLPFKLNLESPQGYQQGKYKLAGESFKTGTYGDLELNRYAIKLEPIA